MIFRFLYRGVSKKIHQEGKGLDSKLPKTTFSSYLEMGSSISEMGSGGMMGCAEENAVLGHQYNSSEYKTSGISTTPNIERARYYATRNNTRNGVIYKIDTEKFTAFEITSYKVSDMVNYPKVHEDNEIILVHIDKGTLPEGIVVEEIEISSTP